MNYAKIKYYDVANGPGVRLSLFVSGCEHRCPECFNPEAWDFEYGNSFTDETLKEILPNLQPTYISGMSILGGEPLHPRNRQTIENICKVVVAHSVPIWIWTGYRLEDLLQENDSTIKNILKCTCTLVDGRFDLEKKDPHLRFRGSSNQRIIDVPKTMINYTDSESQIKIVERREYY